MFVDPSKVSNLPTSIEELEDEIDMMMDQDNVRSVSVGAFRTFNLAFWFSAKKNKTICKFEMSISQTQMKKTKANNKVTVQHFRPSQFV